MPRLLVITATLVVGLSGLVLFATLPPSEEPERPTVDRAIGELRTAEDYFFEHDSDANGVRDYWTGDVAGLYRFGLISRELAEADAAPLQPLTATPRPYQGYFFVALKPDADDGKAFVFCAFPAKYDPERRTPTYIYIIGERAGALFKSDTKGAPVTRLPSDAELSLNWAK